MATKERMVEVLRGVMAFEGADFGTTMQALRELSPFSQLDEATQAELVEGLADCLRDDCDYESTAREWYETADEETIANDLEALHEDSEDEED